MATIKWIKHILTGLSLMSLIVGGIQFLRLDVASEEFGNSILSGIFFLFVFVVLAVYRISWIGHSRWNWIATLLALTTLSFLMVMLMAPKNVLALWKLALATFVLLCGYTFFLKVDRSNWMGKLALLLLLSTIALFLYPLFLRTGSEGYFSIAGYFLFATFLIASINTALPSKK